MISQHRSQLVETLGSPQPSRDFEVVLHVGHVKTASTWLQETIFSNPASGFVIPWDNAGGRAMTAFFTVNSYCDDSAWARTFFEEGLRRSADGPGIPIISEENLCGNPGGRIYTGRYVADRPLRLPQGQDPDWCTGAEVPCHIALSRVPQSRRYSPFGRLPRPWGRTAGLQTDHVPGLPGVRSGRWLLSEAVRSREYPRPADRVAEEQTARIHQIDLRVLPMLGPDRAASGGQTGRLPGKGAGGPPET
jgi:hypothetical protein